MERPRRCINSVTESSPWTIEQNAPIRGPKRSAVPIGAAGLNGCQTVTVKIVKDVIFHMGIQVDLIAGRAVTIHHQRDMQTITKILKDDGGSLCVFVPADTIHAAAFIQQHRNRHIKAFLGRQVFGKYLLVRTI